MFDFYTSDTHFGHTNILKHQDRYKLWQTAEEMDEGLVQRWNSVVGAKDTILHLGDVFFHLPQVLGRLNGKKFLIIGNHDHKQLRELSKHFTIHERDIVVDKDKKTVMSHYPIYDWPHKFHGWSHIHGHSHGTKIYDPMAVDVGVDCWDYTPITFDKVLEKIKSQ